MSSMNLNPAVLSDRDVNTSEPKNVGGGGVESSLVGFGLENKKTLEYHRQMLHSKLKGEEYATTTSTVAVPKSILGRSGCGFADGCVSGLPQYVSPSDGIMSPCTAKLSAYKSKHFMKGKPQSLFAKQSAKTMPAQEFAGFQTVGAARNDQVNSDGSSGESSEVGESQ